MAPWHRGYIKIGEAKMYGNAKIDLKESFIWGQEVAADAETGTGISLRGPNQWPASLHRRPSAEY